MAFDINIISLEQKEIIKTNYDSKITIINEIDEPLRYEYIWPILYNLNGIWYNLGITKKDENGKYLDTLTLIDTDFDNTGSEKLLPFWINDEDIYLNFTPLKIFPEYQKDFLELLNFFLDVSPIKKIVFMVRYQGGEEETFYGTIKLNQFSELLRKEEIMCNIAYFVTK